MGCWLIVCEQCGQINTDESEHFSKCDRPKMSRYLINKRSVAIDEDFGDHYLSSRILTNWVMFWRAIDYWILHRGKKESKTEEYRHVVDFIKSYMYGFKYTVYK